MVAGEIALALALLSGAAIVVQAARYFEAPVLAYDPSSLSQAAMELEVERDTTVYYASVMHQLVSHARALPDVADAAVSSSGRPVGNMVTASDPSSGPQGFDAPMYGFQIVSPGYLRTLHLPILAGRDFLDGTPAHPEVIVDKKTARMFWPNGNPIGAQIKLGSPSSNAPWLRVVGVVANRELESPLDRSAPGGALAQRFGDIYYVPSGTDTLRVHKFAGFSVTVRAKSDPKRMPVTLLSRLRVPPLHLWGAWRAVSLTSFAPTRNRHDFVAAMYALFATLALGLASLGVYGIIVHSVAERRRELGVRIALGANARQVLHAVLREGNVVALTGIALGLLITKYTMTWLHGFILEDAEYEAQWFAAMAAVLFVAVVIAALLPALRATRIDPVESMRNE